MRWRKFLVLILLIFIGISSSIYLILGVPFLKGRCIRVPVLLSQFPDKPLIKIKIENQKYTMLIDTGCSWPVVLQERVLQTLKNKELVGSVTSIDVKGNSYILPRFKIQSIDLSSLRIQEPIVIQESINFITTGSELWPTTPISARKERELKFIDGTVGLKILKNYHCLIDFPHSTLLLAENREALQKEMGYSLEGFLPISFDLEKCGIVISMETDLGIQRFWLDTGATRSIINKDLVDLGKAKEVETGKWLYTSRKLSAAEHDFGRWEFVLCNITSHLKNIDGVLGFDFFNKYPIYFDFQEKKAYVLRGCLQSQR